MYKDLGIGYVFLVNNDDASKMDNVLNAYLIAGKSGLKNTKPIAHKAAKVDPKVYDAYVGRYADRVRHDRDAHPRGGSSHGPAQQRGQDGALPGVGDRVLPQTATDATATFVKDDKGKVTHIVLHRDGNDTKAKTARRAMRRPRRARTPGDRARRRRESTFKSLLLACVTPRRVAGWTNRRAHARAS